MSRSERCRNPWNGKCRNTDIEVYILYKGLKRPICSRCWSKIAKSNIEWGEPSPAEDSSASRRSRVGAGSD